MLRNHPPEDSCSHEALSLSPYCLIWQPLAIRDHLNLNQLKLDLEAAAQMMEEVKLIEFWRQLEGSPQDLQVQLQTILNATKKKHTGGVYHQ